MNKEFYFRESKTVIMFENVGKSYCFYWYRTVTFTFCFCYSIKLENNGASIAILLLLPTFEITMKTFRQMLRYWYQKSESNFSIEYYLTSFSNFFRNLHLNIMYFNLKKYMFCGDTNKRATLWKFIKQKTIWTTNALYTMFTSCI